MSKRNNVKKAVSKSSKNKSPPTNREVMADAEDTPKYSSKMNKKDNKIEKTKRGQQPIPAPVENSHISDDEASIAPKRRQLRSDKDKLSPKKMRTKLNLMDSENKDVKSHDSDDAPTTKGRKGRELKSDKAVPKRKRTKQNPMNSDNENKDVKNHDSDDTPTTKGRKGSEIKSDKVVPRRKRTKLNPMCSDNSDVENEYVKSHVSDDAPTTKGRKGSEIKSDKVVPKRKRTKLNPMCSDTENKDVKSHDSDDAPTTKGRELKSDRVVPNRKRTNQNPMCSDNSDVENEDVKNHDSDDTPTTKGIKGKKLRSDKVVPKRKRTKQNPMNSDNSDVENKDVKSHDSEDDAPIAPKGRKLRPSKGAPRKKRTKLNSVASVSDDSDFEPSSSEASSHDSDETPIQSKGRKRTRLNPTDSEDSAFENTGDNEVKGKKNKLSLKKKLQKYEPNQSSKNNKLKSNLSSKGPAVQPSKPIQEGTADEGNWTYCKLEWLKPEKVRDAKKRRPDHPDYDQRTLFVPPEFLDKQTPFHRQWWEMKASHYDCVLFHKMGRWYELYHMDAAVGVNELGLSYMNQGALAHASFVESAYPRMVTVLVRKGYKVARIEQTETPEMVLERCKKMGSSCTKWDKIIIREICQVEVKGAQVCNLIDGDPTEPDASYMMAIVEEGGTGCSQFGVCFLDASIGVFHLGQFQDDKHSSRLLTMLAHYPPALVIYDRKTTSPHLSKLLSTHCHNARREPHPMWAPEKTLQVLADKYYATRGWPEGIKPFLHKGDALTPASNSSLAIKALGGCVSYLTDCLLDIQILGMSQFKTYAPPGVLNKTLPQENKVDNRWKGGNTMVLDATTLKNLRIVQDEGCLYEKMNFCSTAMGKRRLYQWVCAPSCDLTVIKERQEAVKTLMEKQELCQEAKTILTTLPDLERLLAKVHTLGNLQRSKIHPDARAIFYKEKVSKRKVLDFITVLNGFTAALKLIELFRDEETVLLKRITHFNPVGKLPDIRDTLKFFKKAFNQKEAEKGGFILPDEGVDQEYDNTLQLISDIEMDLKKYLDQQEKHFKCFLSYMGSEKRRYHIKVPEKAASRAGPNYTLEGSGKGFKRYSTAETKDLLARMMAAEEQKTNVLNDISRRIFEKFSSTYDQWMTAVKCISTLDILLSFTEFAQHHQQSGDICLPEVTFDKNQKPYINITEGRHPCIPIENDFIPNDTKLGVDGASLLLLTGPNMGGKSTLMRQVGLLTVLAQLGSYIPAQACSLSLVDRIFTRLGASDDILSGQSTFLVEMNETAAIVRHASAHSLVLLDELGRGTSTYDGTAIASGVCAELAARGPRCVFSTHYHALVTHFANHSAVALGHMACKIETDESSADSDESIPAESITFLYKLSPGACPKSYGFNAARLAGVPRDTTRRAHAVSRDLERDAACARAFRDLIRMDDGKNMRQLLASLSI